MKWARLTSDQLDVYNDVRSIYSISLMHPFLIQNYKIPILWSLTRFNNCAIFTTVNCYFRFILKQAATIFNDLEPLVL